MHYRKQTCHRCGAKEYSLRASWFNVHTLCEKCRNKEVAYPPYQFTQQVEFAKTHTTNFFEGTGLPYDQREKYFRH